MAARTPSKPWRLSSSVVVLAPYKSVPDNYLTDKSSSKPLFDYKVCCVKRGAKSSFMPDTIVFPGGAVELADQELGQALLGGDGLESTLKCAAAREAFEESGVELFSKPLNEPLEVQKAWRKKVHKDATHFKELCQTYGITPSNDMHFWCSFVTPDMEHDKMKRGGFDARFWVYCATAEQVKHAAADDHETVDLLWLTPAEALAAVDKGTISMVPPQWYILNELNRACPSMASVRAYASSEERRLSRDYPIKPYPTAVPSEDQFGFLERKGMPADQEVAKGVFSLCYPGDEKHPVFPGRAGSRHRMVMLGKFGGRLKYELQVVQDGQIPLKEAIPNWYSLAELK